MKNIARAIEMIEEAIEGYKSENIKCDDLLDFLADLKQYLEGI